MKKMIISTIIVLALIFTLPITNINTVKAVEVGDRISYVINEASASYSYSANGSTQSGSTTKFSIANTILDPGDEFNITVKSKSAFLIQFEVTQDEISIGNTSSGSMEFGFGIIYSIIFPFLAMGLASGTFDPDFTNGVSIGDWIFFAPTDVDWDDTKTIFSNQTFWDSVSEEFPDGITFSANSEFLDDGDTLYFEFKANGNYVNATESADLTVDHIMRFDYSVVGRNLLSFKIDTDISGTLESVSATYKTNLEVVKKGYSIGSEGIPGFEMILTLFSIGILTTVVKKRKL